MFCVVDLLLLLPLLPLVPLTPQSCNTPFTHTHTHTHSRKARSVRMITGSFFFRFVVPVFVLLVFFLCLHPVHLLCCSFSYALSSAKPFSPALPNNGHVSVIVAFGVLVQTTRSTTRGPPDDFSTCEAAAAEKFPSDLTVAVVVFTFHPYTAPLTLTLKFRSLRGARSGTHITREI